MIIYKEVLSLKNECELITNNQVFDQINEQIKKKKIDKYIH